jgi:hypothetical protein
VDAAKQFGLNVGMTNYTGPLLEHFIAGDSVDLKNVPSAGLVLNYATSTGDLQISSGGAVLATLQFQNSSLGTGTFHTAADGIGTLLTHS